MKKKIILYYKLKMNFLKMELLKLQFLKKKQDLKTQVNFLTKVVTELRTELKHYKDIKKLKKKLQLILLMEQVF